MRSTGTAAGSPIVANQAADAARNSPLPSARPWAASVGAAPCRASRACAVGRLRREVPSATAETLGSTTGGMVGKPASTASASPTSVASPLNQACKTSRCTANQGQVTSGSRVVPQLDSRASRGTMSNASRVLNVRRTASST